MATRDKVKERTSDEWKQLIKDFESSGQKRIDFCKEIGINPYTFKKRYYQLRGDKGGDVGKKGFVGFKILHPSAAGIKVHLPNGVNIDVIGQDALKLIKELMNVA
jgi:hypothetical protein